MKPEVIGNNQNVLLVCVPKWLRENKNADNIHVQSFCTIQVFSVKGAQYSVRNNNRNNSKQLIRGAMSPDAPLYGKHKVILRLPLPAFLCHVANCTTITQLHSFTVSFYQNGIINRWFSCVCPFCNEICLRNRTLNKICLFFKVRNANAFLHLGINCEFLKTGWNT